MGDLLNRWLFHLTPERTIWLGGHHLSWDARCAGIYCGFGIALCLLVCCYQRRILLPPVSTLILAAAFSLPMFLDVASLSLQLRPADLTIKHLTGSWFGSAFCCLLYPAVMQMLSPPPSAKPLRKRHLLLIAAVAAAFSCLTLWDQTTSFYLLESASWLGFIGLALLMTIGLLSALRPDSSKNSLSH